MRLPASHRSLSRTSSQQTRRPRMPWQESYNECRIANWATATSSAPHARMLILAVSTEVLGKRRHPDRLFSASKGLEICSNHRFLSYCLLVAEKSGPMHCGPGVSYIGLANVARDDPYLSDLGSSARYPRFNDRHGKGHSSSNDQWSRYDFGCECLFLRE